MSLGAARSGRGLLAASALLVASWLSGCAAPGLQASAGDGLAPTQVAAQDAQTAVPMQPAAAAIVVPPVPDTSLAEGQACGRACDRALPCPTWTTSW
jgi:hypothetical protein